MKFLVEKVDIKDLKKDDEIMVSSQSGLRYYRVLKDMRPSSRTRKNWKTGADVPWYPSLKCSANIEIETYYLNTYGGKPKEKKIKHYMFTPDDHNTNVYLNLNRVDVLKVIK